MSASPLPALEVQPRDLWPEYRPSTLLELPMLARKTSVGRVFVKNESERPLGNFKVLGGMMAGLQALARATGATPADIIGRRVRPESLPQLITASDGNHGLSVAAAAHRAGGRAAIYLPAGVNRVRAQRIEAFGAEIVWIKGTYDEAVDAAAAAAARGEGLLIPDTSPDPADRVVRDVMAGYVLMTRELIAQFDQSASDRPTHVFVQAGVGGLAAAVAEGFHDFMQEPRRVVVVEPEAAPCVARALEARRPVQVKGNLHTAAEMLACGLASASAVEILLEHHARAVLVPETQLSLAVDALWNAGGPRTTPSGATGLAGLLHVSAREDLRSPLQLTSSSVVLFLATEGPVPL